MKGLQVTPPTLSYQELTRPTRLLSKLQRNVNDQKELSQCINSPQIAKNKCLTKMNLEQSLMPRAKSCTIKTTCQISMITRKYKFL